MPENPKINWDDMAKKTLLLPEIEEPLAPARPVQLGPGVQGTFHGDTSQIPAGVTKPKIDWDQANKNLNPQGDWLQAPSATPGEIRPQEHPKQGRMQKILGDIRYGPSTVKDPKTGEYVDTSPEARILRGTGFTGLERGVPAGVSGMLPVAGAVRGIPELINTGMQVPQVNSLEGAERLAHEGFQGGFHTLAGAAPFLSPAALPSFVPAIATGGVASDVAQKGATVLGADEPTANLIGDVSAVGAPTAARFGEPVGRTAQRAAPGVAKTLGYGASALGLYKNHNPLDLLFGSKLATKPAELLIRAGGKGLESVGNEVGNIIRDTAHPEHPGITDLDQEILQLGRGSLITPPPVPPAEETMKVQPAQAQVIRGKGGRMTKQFTAESSTGKTQMMPGQAWRGPGSPPPTIEGQGKPEPLIQPNEPQGAQPVGQPESAIEQARRGAIIPEDVKSIPLTNGPKSDIINNMQEKTVPSEATPPKGAEQAPKEEQVDLSRRNFLKSGAKALVGMAAPKGTMNALAKLAPQDLNEAITSNPELSGNLLLPIAKAFTGYLNNFGDENDVKFDPKEVLEDSEIQSVNKQGSNTIVHALMNMGDDGGPADAIVEFSPDGKILRYVHGFDGVWDLAVKGGILGSENFDSIQEPKDEWWINHLENQEGSDEGITDFLPPEHRVDRDTTPLWNSRTLKFTETKDGSTPESVQKKWDEDIEKSRAEWYKKKQNQLIETNERPPLDKDYDEKALQQQLREGLENRSKKLFDEETPWRRRSLIQTQ